MFLILRVHLQFQTNGALLLMIHTATARNDICRTLVTLVTVNYGTYERSHIREAAHKLVSKYPFMADDWAMVW